MVSTFSPRMYIDRHVSGLSWPSRRESGPAGALEGFVEVFMFSGSEPITLEKIADEFYKEGRCGFFHDGMIRAKILFAPEMDEALRATLPKVNGEIDMDGEIESIFINPNEFLLFIEGHVNSFLNDLPPL